MIVGTEEVLYWFIYLFIKYIIYFKHILKYGWVGSGLAGLQFYDPNLTRPVIKKKKKKKNCNPTQPTKP